MPRRRVHRSAGAELPPDRRRGEQRQHRRRVEQQRHDKDEPPQRRLAVGAEYCDDVSDRPKSASTIRRSPSIPALSTLSSASVLACLMRWPARPARAMRWSSASFMAAAVRPRWVAVSIAESI